MPGSKTRRVGLGPPMQSWWGKPHPTSMSSFGASLVLLALITIFPVPIFGKTAVGWDFSKGLQGWTGNNQVENLSSSAEGLAVKSTGQDPWIESPAVELPGDGIIRVKIRMKSNADAGGELFYGKTFKAGDSVPFTVRADGQWHDYSLVIRNKLGPGTRFRLDPCTGPGEVVIASIQAEAISEIIAPPLEKPKEPDRTAKSRVSVKSGNLKFEQYGGKWGNFSLSVNDEEMAAGYDNELIGVVFDEKPEWLNLKDAVMTFENQTERNESASTAVIRDRQGGKWEIRRIVSPAKMEGTITITTELTVDKDRDIVYVPWLTLFPGLGTFGERKDQGLFAGVEYLSDEPSSSQADITTPDHIRRVPDPLKITFPLMAISHGGNYIGVIWKPSESIAATFDSPDRIYNSGAHVMSLSGPGVGELRFENDFCAHTPLRLQANKPLKVSVLIIGGKGKTVIPAVKHYVALKGLPALPEFEGGLNAAVDLLSHGWLDSKINQEGSDTRSGVIVFPPARQPMPLCSSTGLPIIPVTKHLAGD